MKKKKDMFGDMKGYAIGLGGLGITGAVASSAAAQAPAGTPNLMGGYNAMASFTPAMGAVVGGGTVLKMTKKLNKKNKY